MVSNFMLMKTNQNYLATVMQIGQEMLTLEDQHVFQIGSSTISWSSKKQATVAKSSTEAEYVALSSATQEAVWLPSLMGDLGRQLDAPTIIYEDNQGAIELAKNAKYHN